MLEEQPLSMRSCSQHLIPHQYPWAQTHMAAWNGGSSLFLLLFKDCSSQINFATNMANTTINVGKTATSMDNAAANMASTAMNVVNSATSVACHKQRVA